MARKPTSASGFLDIDLVGDDVGVQRMLSHLDSALSPVGLAGFLYGSVQPWLLRRAKDRFASEGDDASGKWAPLQQATIEIRENQGFGAGPINRRTRELEEYITGGGVDIVSAPMVSTLRFPGKAPSGHVAEKVKTAQKGKRSPSTVARPVLAVSERDLAAVMTQLAFHIQGWGQSKSKSVVRG